MLHGKALEKEIKSPTLFGWARNITWRYPQPGQIGPGHEKNCGGHGGLKSGERSVVTRVIPGRIHHVDTELGDVKTPVIVLATNAYSHKIGFFKNRGVPHLYLHRGPQNP